MCETGLTDQFSSLFNVARDSLPSQSWPDESPNVVITIPYTEDPPCAHSGLFRLCNQWPRITALSDPLWIVAKEIDTLLCSRAHTHSPSHHLLEVF
jgi:hypothetical protein